MRLLRFENRILEAIGGQFTPDQFGARLFMHREDMSMPENYLVWFHERFHYLQSVFTSYGHLKWGSYRTVTSDIIDTWLSLTERYEKEKKIPIAEYIADKDRDSIRIAVNVWFHNTMYQLYSIIEYGNEQSELQQIAPALFQENKICPEIEVQGRRVQFRGIDVIESFAKFEEAMMAELLLGKTIDESIDPNYLNPEYYIALYYFVEQVGPERLLEFPVVCELSLSSAHIMNSKDPESIYRFAPNWRFVRIIDAIKNTNGLPELNVSCDGSFYAYANEVLLRCGYESYEESWRSADEYATQSDLKMASEMKAAIEYKREHPWMLSYPMCKREFLSEEFNKFEPYFTITNDGVMYNTDRITSTELIYENHFQALSAQICGRVSPYCQDTWRLMCGFSYTGTNTCPHYLAGECDGYVDCESEFPKVVIDEDNNIVRGCTFEIVLNTMGVSVRNIMVGRVRSLGYSELKKAIEGTRR